MSAADRRDVVPPAAEPVDRSKPPSLGELFLAFSGVAVVGFGGVMPFARRMLVEQRRWMTPDEFNDAYSVAQFLPGGNILNLAVLVGQRHHGALGSFLAVAGLLAAPFVIMVLLGVVYQRYGEVPAVHDALAGVAAGAAGLIVTMAAKMADPLVRRRAAIPIAIAALAFLAAGVAQLPLLAVVAVLAPLSVALAWMRVP
jgi:chromate transporter